MFQVKNKETGKKYTVYAVGDEYLTRFLIYEDNHWNGNVWMILFQ